MADKINICNQALLLLGEGVIQSLDEKTVQGRACAVFYQTARNAVITDIQPNFAVRRSTELAASSPPPFEYSHSFGLPQDCEAVMSAWQGGQKFTAWRKEGSDLLCNFSAGVMVRYISIAGELEARMQGVFVEALSAYLASRLTYTLTNARLKLGDMLDLYTLKKTEAQNLYGQESGEQTVENDQLTWMR